MTWIRSYPVVVDSCCNGLTETCRSVRNVRGSAGRSRRWQRLEAAAAQCAFHHGEDGVVVDDPVYQQDRRLGRLDAVVEKSALFWIEASEIVAAARRDRRGAENSPSGYITMWAVAQAASIARPDATRGQSSVTRRGNPAGDNAPIGTGPHDQILPSSRFGVVESDVPVVPIPPLRELS